MIQYHNFPLAISCQEHMHIILYNQMTRHNHLANFLNLAWLKPFFLFAISLLLWALHKPLFTNNTFRVILSSSQRTFTHSLVLFRLFLVCLLTFIELVCLLTFTEPVCLLSFTEHYLVSLYIFLGYDLLWCFSLQIFPIKNTWILSYTIKWQDIITYQTSST